MRSQVHYYLPMGSSAVQLQLLKWLGQQQQVWEFSWEMGTMVHLVDPVNVQLMQCLSAAAAFCLWSALTLSIGSTLLHWSVYLFLDL